MNYKRESYLDLGLLTIFFSMIMYILAFKIDMLFVIPSILSFIISIVLLILVYREEDLI